MTANTVSTVEIYNIVLIDNIGLNTIDVRIYF